MDLKFNDSVIEKSKLKSSIIDYVKAVYKPVLSEYKKDDELTDDVNEVAEEYHRLVFFIKKIRCIFDAFKRIMKELTGREVFPATREGKALFFSTHRDIVGDVKEYLKNTLEHEYFKFLKNISEIPTNTEFSYLGFVDTIDLEKYLAKFDPTFKSLINAVLVKKNVNEKEHDEDEDEKN
jgi:hypothetical protein